MCWSDYRTLKLAISLDSLYSLYLVTRLPMQWVFVTHFIVPSYFGPVFKNFFNVYNFRSKLKLFAVVEDKGI